MDHTQGYHEPAPGTGYTADPSAVPGKKPGIADKVKGMLGGHGHKADAAHHGQQPVYGDATPAAGSAASTRVGCLDKLKAKTGVGHGLAPAQTRAQHAGGGGGYTDPSGSPDFNGGTNVNSSAAVHGGWPQPTNPNRTAVGEPHHGRDTHNHPTGLPNPFSADHAGAGGYGATNPTVVGESHPGRETHNHPTGLLNPFSEPRRDAGAGGYGAAQPMNPTGATNAQGGAVLGDRHGNVYEGPRDDNEKKEGFVSNIMDKLHSPKGKPGHNTNTTTTTTTPTTY